MTQRDQGSLVRLTEAKQQATAAKASIDQEVAEQAAQTAEMAKRKLAAEKALAAAGGGQRTNVNTSGAANAKPAPRNSDGSWPKESCSISDPTPADGCITPRTNHSLNEGKAAGFNWYVSCFRQAGTASTRRAERATGPRSRAASRTVPPAGPIATMATGWPRSS